jgi:hypothetical protein
LASLFFCIAASLHHNAVILSFWGYHRLISMIFWAKIFATIFLYLLLFNRFSRFQAMGILIRGINVQL